MRNGFLCFQLIACPRFCPIDIASLSARPSSHPASPRNCFRHIEQEKCALSARDSYEFGIGSLDERTNYIRKSCKIESETINWCEWEIVECIMHSGSRAARQTEKIDWLRKPDRSINVSHMHMDANWWQNWIYTPLPMHLFQRVEGRKGGVALEKKNKHKKRCAKKRQCK